MRLPTIATRLWVERVVIGLSLCPWVRPVHDRAALRFTQTNSADTEGLFACLLNEMDSLSSRSTHETVIVVAPQAFPDDFVAFNDFVQDVEEWLREQRLDSTFQLVGFHPHFTFAGESYDDAGNFVNRSPAPAFHLLRQDDVTKAVDSSPTALEVPQVNQKLLRELGTERLRTLVREVEEEARAEDDRP